MITLQLSLISHYKTSWLIYYNVLSIRPTRMFHMFNKPRNSLCGVGYCDTGEHMIEKTKRFHTTLITKRKRIVRIISATILYSIGVTFIFATKKKKRKKINYKIQRFINTAVGFDRSWSLINVSSMTVQNIAKNRISWLINHLFNNN